MSIEYPQPQLLMENALLVDTVFFNFEDDFVADDVRCIPMIVRFKLDACGIKLKLQEWSKMTIAERTLLAQKQCSTTREINQYRQYLRTLVMQHTGKPATDLPVDENPDWAVTGRLPFVLLEQAAAFGWQLSLRQWNHLTNLQRFVLLKLCRPGHENRNFPIAYREFGLA